MLLHPEKFLIAIILDDFGKKSHRVVLILELTNTVQEYDGPLNNQGSKAVLLIQVREHVLLHCLPGHSALHTLLIKFDFLRLNVMY
jgi:hypothetical protein